MAIIFHPVLTYRVYGDGISTTAVIPQNTLPSGGIATFVRLEDGPSRIQNLYFTQDFVNGGINVSLSEPLLDASFGLYTFVVEF
jgi:hypothetical protein